MGALGMPDAEDGETKRRRSSHLAVRPSLAKTSLLSSMRNVANRSSRVLPTVSAKHVTVYKPHEPFHRVNWMNNQHHLDDDEEHPHGHHVFGPVPHTKIGKMLQCFAHVLDRVFPPYQRAKVYYRFDTWIAKRSYQLVFLSTCMFLWMLVGGFFYSTVNSDVIPGASGLVSEAIWEAWTFMADPGVHAEVGSLCKDLLGSQDPNYFSCMWSQRVLAMVITGGGIFFFAIVLGFVVDAIREKMDSLKKGKTQVLESGHTLILGWTDKTVAIIKEIALANASCNGGTVVLMGTEEKELLDRELREQIRPGELTIDGATTRVVTRTGSPLFSADLLKVSANNAKTIIILGNDQVSADRSDAQTLRAVLTLMGLKVKLKGHIVAEVRDVDNEALVKLVGGDSVETVVSHDIMGRLMLLSARQPGLAKVYESILGFDGDEFYLSEWPELQGKKFRDMTLYFKDAIPIGYKTVNGEIILNPPGAHEMKAGEEIVVIAEDDDTYKAEVQAKEQPYGSPPPETGKVHQPPERILFCGWRRDIRDILLQLDAMVAPGSELHMMSEVKLVERGKILRESGMDSRTLKNLTVINHYGNTAVRRKLEKLPVEEFNSVMVMADESRETDLMHSDSHTLATLLLLRDIQKTRKFMRLRRAFGRNEMLMQLIRRWGPKNDGCSCVCEILDARTQRTIMANRSISLESDFVQSNTLISRVLAMVSEDRSVRVILDELLAVDGCGFKVERSSRFVHPDEEVSNSTQLYQKRRSISNTVVNPPDKDKPKRWNEYDLVLLVGDSILMRNNAALHQVVDAFRDMLRKKKARGLIASDKAEDEDELLTQAKRRMDAVDEALADAVKQQCLAAASDGTSTAANDRVDLYELEELISSQTGVDSDPLPSDDDDDENGDDGGEDELATALAEVERGDSAIPDHATEDGAEAVSSKAASSPARSPSSRSQTTISTKPLSNDVKRFQSMPTVALNRSSTVSRVDVRELLYDMETNELAETCTAALNILLERNRK